MAPRHLTRRQLAQASLAALAASQVRAEPDGGVSGFDAVSNLAPARGVLWSWTTADQAEALRKGGPLLTRETNSDGSRGYLFSVLARRQGAGPHLLTSKRFAKGRYGWWNPWATCAGFHGESWGDRLLKVELLPTAWLVVVHSARADTVTVDLDNHPVSDKALEKQPERLAGAFFVHDAEGKKRSSRWCDPTTSGAFRGYREVYLGNEKLVRRWSLGTPEIAARLRADAGALEALAGSPGLDEHFDACAFEKGILRDWESGGAPAGQVDAYRRALAFADAPYQPHARPLKALATRLRALIDDSKPFVHEAEK